MEFKRTPKRGYENFGVKYSNLPIQAGGGLGRKVEWKRLEVGAEVEAEPVWVEQSHHRSLDRSPEAE
jgi:hypothetical protein